MANQDSYLKARQALRSALDAGKSETVSLTRAEADALLTGHPPQPDLPPGHAMFSAALVPFLRVVLDHEDDVFSRGGITVTPHPAGGAVLATINGPAMLLARDPGANVSPGGCRVLMPRAALDACDLPAAPQLMAEGEAFDVARAPWTVPGRVFCIGASLMVEPAEQPPCPPGHNPKGWGGALWSGMIETSNHWRDTDARRLDPVPWWNAVAAMVRPDRVPKGQFYAMTSFVLGLLGRATTALPGANFWAPSDLGDALVFTCEERPDLAIIVMKALGAPPVGLPGWATECSPEAALS